MRTSTETGELFSALAKAQGEFPTIPKNQTVEVKKDGKLLYAFSYADLTQIIDSTRPSLHKNGLSFTQSMIKDEFLGVGFVTRIMHSSGQWCETGFVPAVLNERSGMKEIAGVTTYGKRLSLSQALGVSADDDMDAPVENNEVLSKLNGSSPQPKSAIPEMKKAEIQKLAPPRSGEVRVRAIVERPGTEAKKAGFQFNNATKEWLKVIPSEQVQRNSFPFEVEVVS